MEIYVGNLSKKVTKEDLQSLFEKYGTVSLIKFKKDLFSGESKGYAFVVMPVLAEAEKAIEKSNGKKILGQKIIVKEARSHDQDWDKRGKRGRPF
ncbi:MAG: RNA-binding protein [Tissierellales bacterium]|nr:RNA-binding protein [Tissierellales bacterium]